MNNGSSPVSGSDQQDTERAKQIFETDWRIYQTLIEHNLFYHREVMSFMNQTITEHFQDGFDFMDLACGDASVVASTLDQTSVSSYQGADLSAQALHIAEQNLAGKPYGATLRQEDMKTVLKDKPLSFDMIWCGLSLHHLPDLAEKAEVFGTIFSALRPGGVFLSFEPVLPKGHSIETFYQALQPALKAEWVPALSTPDFDHMWSHIETCDHPETAQDWLNLGQTAGFERAENLFAMPKTQFCYLFRFEKPATS